MALNASPDIRTVSGGSEEQLPAAPATIIAASSSNRDTRSVAGRSNSTDRKRPVSAGKRIRPVAFLPPRHAVRGADQSDRDEKASQSFLSPVYEVAGRRTASRRWTQARRAGRTFPVDQFRKGEKDGL